MYSRMKRAGNRPNQILPKRNVIYCKVFCEFCNNRLILQEQLCGVDKSTMYMNPSVASCVLLFVRYC